MSQFYFHVRSNGILVEDQAGSAYQSKSDACAFAVGAMPDLLAKALQCGEYTRDHEYLQRRGERLCCAGVDCG